MIKSKRIARAVFLCVVSSLFLYTTATKAQTNGGAAPQPPMTEKKPKTTKIHGVTLVDDYFWLREKTNPAVMAHLQAENDYADAMSASPVPT